MVCTVQIVSMEHKRYMHGCVLFLTNERTAPKHYLLVYVMGSITEVCNLCVRDCDRQRNTREIGKANLEFRNEGGIKVMDSKSKRNEGAIWLCIILLVWTVTRFI